ncbi:hypothetical protein E2562_006606 [Oryza meyeriana var. granulata]|uniref:peptidylprolyl isomerase n=1 Tax=Oryza meyeriana var. granulata TaxID=110450 RepID=A0A6G1EFM7_9ORYZ|nr:hypothetical protein E2562_006606 [Oryza meyeriana var. granulata]
MAAAAAAMATVTTTAAPHSQPCKDAPIWPRTRALRHRQRCGRGAGGARRAGVRGLRRGGRRHQRALHRHRRWPPSTASAMCSSQRPAPAPAATSPPSSGPRRGTSGRRGPTASSLPTLSSPWPWIAGSRTTWCSGTPIPDLINCSSCPMCSIFYLFLNFFFSLYVFSFQANESEAELTKVTSKVYFDITIDGKPTGRTVMGFFGNTVPKTAGEKGVGKSGKPLYYKGTTFHRIIPGFMIQGGDTANGNGTGCDSTYGSIFPDENFKINHSAPELGRSNRLLIMGYSLCCCYRLDGNHVVFGKVLSGMGVVYKIEAEGTQTGAPRCKVVISDSGELK